MPRRVLLLAIGLVLAIVALAGAACGDDGDDGDGGQPTAIDGEETAAPDGAGNEVEVRLLEWSVRPDPDAAPAGDVTFGAINIGGADHELLVIRTDLDPGLLPALDDGSVDEAGEGIELIARTDALAPGDEEDLALTLEPGSYALVCNLIDQLDDGSSQAHYEEGMYVGFTVE